MLTAKTQSLVTMLMLAQACILPSEVGAQTSNAQPMPANAQSVFFSTSEPVMRSNYQKRLADLRDQIDLGLSRGWLSASQANYLKSWESDIAKEEEGLRQGSGGIVADKYTDQLERHVNCLSWMITHELNSANKVAGTNQPTY